jgi:SP family sugar:H+ symporter-like MFS transporter
MSREQASTPLVILNSYAVYAAFATLSFVFVLKWVQETKGKELEAME